jgi:hypothetical protein
MKLREFVNELEETVHRLITDKCLKSGQTPLSHEAYLRSVGHNNGMMEAVAVAKGLLAKASEDDTVPQVEAPRRLTIKGVN